MPNSVLNFQVAFDFNVKNHGYSYPEFKSNKEKYVKRRLIEPSE